MKQADLFVRQAAFHFQELKKNNRDLSFFIESLEYSFFSNGKRVRPSILMSLGEDFGLERDLVFPAAFAVELIHTYSLIHDDLPAMDNDDFRRGQLTHHKKYGEASAVLAGDVFLTYAFEVLADAYSGETLKKLVKLLSHSAGLEGMVGGQVLDCLTKERDRESFRRIHLLKTARLFEYSFGAAAILAKKEEEFYANMGKILGLLFQLQDDLLDEDKADERAEENILSVLSKDQVQQEILKLKNILKEEFRKTEWTKDSSISPIVFKVLERTY